MGNPSFRITISGSGVLPETTSAADLAAFLRNIDEAILETAKAQGVALGGDDIVSLTRIERSSNRLTFTVAAALLPVASTLSHAVQNKAYEVLPRKAHAALYEVSKLAINKKWQVGFDEDPSLNISGGIISEQNEVPAVPPAPLVEGTTSIYGRCIRVGGIKPKAEIRLYHGGSLFIDVSEELAKELARSLYEEVCIEGTAKWNTEDWTIEEFKGKYISIFRPTDAASAFAELAKLAKGRWDGLDALDYVRTLRAEGDTT